MNGKSFRPCELMLPLLIFFVAVVTVVVVVVRFMATSPEVDDGAVTDEMELGSGRDVSAKGTV